MNTTDTFHHGLNGSSQIVFSNDPPPGALFGWPGCTYPLPLRSSGPYGQATKWISKTVPLFLILLGTVGNILTALVILRNHRKLSSTGVYLLALAFTDTLFLYTDPLKRFVLQVFGLNLQGISSIGCKVSMLFTYASFHTSAWILVAVTVERVLSVIWPYKVKRRCTKRIAIIVLLGIVIAVFAMDSHVLYGFGILSFDTYKGSDNCRPLYEGYVSFYNYHWFWIHFIVGFATPFLFIAIGNTLVIQGLRKMRMRQRWMDEQAQNGQKPHSRHHRHHARTLMIILILLNTVFFISQTPLAIFFVYFPYVAEDLNKNACSDFETYMDGMEKLWFWEAIIHTFGYLNASINFVLYVVSGSRFRGEIVSLFMCRKEIQIRSVSSTSDDVNRRHYHSRSV